VKRVILIIIAIACCAMYYNATLQACYRNSPSQFYSKVRSFCSLDFGWKWFQSDPGPGKTLKSRILPNLLSSAMTHNIVKITNGKLDGNPQELATRISLWNAGWMFFTMLVVIFAYDNLLWIFSIFSGCMFNWMPLAINNIYSYDGMILFFWVLMVIFSAKKNMRKWFLPAFLLAISCKETALVCCLVPFMWTDLNFKARAKKALVFLFSGATLKIAIDIAVQNPIPFFTQVTHATAASQPCIIENMQKFKAFTFDTPWLAACGMVLALFLLPNTKEISVWKIISILFIGGIFICGISTEYRIFQEMIPVFLWSYTSIKGNR
jgi:hypothetical protein